MKLQIKETGEIVELVGEFKRSDGKPEFTLDSYETLAELCKAVEDYEEPKKYWFIYANGKVDLNNDDGDDVDKERKQIGNYFKTKEDAEKVVEKLKALNRLRNNNLRIRRGCMTFVNTDEVYTTMNVRVKVDTYASVDEDLDLLFGGEE